MLKKIITLYSLCIPILIYSTHITFISPPFTSHFYTLQKAAISIKEIHPEYEVKFIILEYTNNNLSKGIEQLQAAHITVSPKTDSMLFKIEKNYIDYLKNLALDLKHTNLIVYDHWILEAEIIGRYLHIPTMCCLSGALAPYNHMQQTLNAQKNKKREKFQTIEQTFHISCFDDLQWKFNHLILPSQHTNVLYGYPLLIESRNSKLGRNLYTVHCVIDKKPLIQNENFIIPQKKNNQKLIYMAFGSNLDSKDFLKDFLQNIYTWLTQNFGNNENYIFIWGNAGNLKSKFRNIPSNFYIYDCMIPQEEILKLADVFITHAGDHSINEAITYEVPMLAIPFLHDQHFIAKHIAQSNLGKAFLHPESLENKAIFSSSKLAERPSLNQETLKDAILNILSNSEFYKENMRKIKQVPPQNFAKIIEKIIEDLF
ncbi:hypothetical protein EBQ93_00420 [bacterium]|nr:hypothetical protein [bacterium]